MVRDAEDYGIRQVFCENLREKWDILMIVPQRIPIIPAEVALGSLPRLTLPANSINGSLAID